MVNFSLENSIILHPVRNDRGCSCCYAYVATSCMSTRHARDYDQLIELSKQHIVDSLTYDSADEAKPDDQGCIKSHPVVVFEFARENGVHMEHDYRYEAWKYRSKSKLTKKYDFQRKFGRSHSMVTSLAKIMRINRQHNKKYPVMKILGYHELDILIEHKGLSEGHINFLLESGYPISATVEIGKNFKNLSAGETWEGEDEESSTSTHFVTLVGHGTDKNNVKCFRALNDWGKKWCDKGFCNIRRDLAKELTIPQATFMSIPNDHRRCKYGKRLDQKRMDEWRDKIKEWGLKSDEWRSTHNPPLPPARLKKRKNRNNRIMERFEERDESPVPPSPPKNSKKRKRTT